MRHPPLAPGWIDRPHQRTAIGDLPLESGGILQECELVWVEHGRRDPSCDNTVLVCTAIGSTHHRLDFLIGEGLALDTKRLHVIAVDALAGGLSSSPSNSLRQPGEHFPRFGIRDLVESQRRLLDQLGIGRLHAVIGASMGGMQALQWAVSHPHRIRNVVAMTPMARTSRWSQLVNELSRRALFEDAAFTRPRPRADAMRLWAPLTQLVMPSTPAAVSGFGDAAAMHAWIDERCRALASHGPDPYDWLSQTIAYDGHDVGATAGFGGDTAAALRAIRARVLVLAPPLDLYNPAHEARALCADIDGATFVEIPSSRGHQSASGIDAADIRFLDREISRFLAMP
jgi:homoserine O-acetyltransferase/O-succinyltransferase